MTLYITFDIINTDNGKEAFYGIDRSAAVSPAEAERIKTVFKTAGISNAEALKRAAARIEQGDDLTREYDRETDSLKPL